MSGHWEKYFTINGKNRWEGTLKNLGGGPVYRFDNSFYTQKQLEEISTEWGDGYVIDSYHYTEKTLRSCLSNMTKHPDLEYEIAGKTVTREELGEILKSLQTPVNLPDDTPQSGEDAVKRHKEVVAEAKRLRELLAEKEAEIIEYERIMGLEAGRV